MLFERSANSYVSRHSFLPLMPFLKMFPLAAISAMFGTIINFLQLR